MYRNSKTIIWFFKKVNKIDKPLQTDQEKKEYANHQHQKLRRWHHDKVYRYENDKREYHEQLFASTFNNLDKMGNFLETKSIRNN